ncbi:hypothetical protein QTH90_00505 [Variovorax sp. J2P1-59]|uniref:hypothetical protein n=1 Tax=Variovorax flavidus TaxID=3053501 RepID=UPI0025770106|nr:hypothetical protein [Variovorax sp. J2P1-59]MDM0072845.1 hypothetical protein [Variovorax sp. J2P1-59]
MSAGGMEPLSKGEEYLGGAFGAGAVLVVLPCVALYFGIDKISAHPAVGLPILAIFGIMILFGALALISTLFARLNLQDRTQALGLPEGSIRAAIALALIVLFAIIAIMLYQAVARVVIIPDLERSRMEAMTAERVNSANVIAVVPNCGRKPVANCPEDELRYSVHMRQPASQESADLAKQLLILIGTLMTSVTSFYFASRALEPKREQGSGETRAPTPSPRGPTAGDSGPGAVAAAPPPDGTENHVDGCDVEINTSDATPDDQLPPARGGVA